MTAPGRKLHLVGEDIRAGKLVKIRVEGAPARAQVLSIRAIHRKDAPPGPAESSLIQWLNQAPGR